MTNEPLQASQRAAWLRRLGYVLVLAGVGFVAFSVGTLYALFA